MKSELDSGGVVFGRVECSCAWPTRCWVTVIVVVMMVVVMVVEVVLKTTDVQWSVAAAAAIEYRLWANMSCLSRCYSLPPSLLFPLSLFHRNDVWCCCYPFTGIVVVILRLLLFLLLLLWLLVVVVLLCACRVRSERANERERWRESALGEPHIENDSVVVPSSVSFRCRSFARSFSSLSLSFSSFRFLDVTRRECRPQHQQWLTDWNRPRGGACYYCYDYDYWNLYILLFRRKNSSDWRRH